jgi:hypothetical protein
MALSPALRILSHNVRGLVKRVDVVSPSCGPGGIWVHTSCVFRRLGLTAGLGCLLRHSRCFWTVHARRWGCEVCLTFCSRQTPWGLVTEQGWASSYFVVQTRNLFCLRMTSAAHRMVGFCGVEYGGAGTGLPWATLTDRLQLHAVGSCLLLPATLASAVSSPRFSYPWYNHAPRLGVWSWWGTSNMSQMPPLIAPRCHLGLPTILTGVQMRLLP